MENKKSFILRHSLYPALEYMDDATAGELIKAIFIYSMTGEQQEVPPMARATFAQVCAQLDEDTEKYKETCERNREAVLKRWANAQEK